MQITAIGLDLAKRWRILHRRSLGHTNQPFSMRC
jgi:hypothetical protein